ncbi:7TM diverse intracellular signaling domain-containing protein [Pedobacter sp.]|uniref:7TM diverse intracellular signaling domain-containing protein n=1 Tax=Pedobacter sp. TaxID=1411316 RepID=UPI00396CD53F
MKFISGFTLYLLILLGVSSVCKGKEIFLSEKNAQKNILLKPFFYAVEDSLDIYSPTQILQQTSYFKRLNQFSLSSPDHTIWLKASLKTAQNLNYSDFCITFPHLTFVELYLFEGEKLISYRKAGAFRKKTAIHAGDSRFMFNVSFSKGTTYQLLFKIKHTKKYPPDFNFTLQTTYSSLYYKKNIDIINALLQGALCVLFIYSALSWLVNRYRPFLWVTLFILFLGLYGFSLGAAYIDILFPMHPETGWLLVLVFLHLGILSFYLLIVDFLEVRKNSPRLYSYSRIVIIGLPIFSVLCLFNNILTSNYYLTNLINLYISVVHVSYIISTFTLWKKLDNSQRFLLYGIIVFVLGVICLVSLTAVLHEQGFIYAPIITQTCIVLITILFLTGINLKLKQHEHEKIETLKQLNRLHQEHNIIVERKVEERTLELQASNHRLKEQQQELINHRNHIQTLMDELSHRVKNNLQMLYGLSSFQLPGTEQAQDKYGFNEMKGRIKAMMLVNEHLNTETEKQHIELVSLTKDLSFHLQNIYDPLKQVQITIEADGELSLHPKQSLPFGLILTELFTNTFKHAFATHSTNPAIKIIISLFKDQIKLTYHDNGKRTNSSSASSMGISLIKDLTRQLKGQVQIDTSSGFYYYFIFSK